MREADARQMRGNRRLRRVGSRRPRPKLTRESPDTWTATFADRNSRQGHDTSTSRWRATSWAGRAYSVRTPAARSYDPGGMVRLLVPEALLLKAAFQSGIPEPEGQETGCVRDPSARHRRHRNSFTARARIGIGLGLRLAHDLETASGHWSPNYEGLVGRQPCFSCPWRPGRSK